jgi:hypothetical protein
MTRRTANQDTAQAAHKAAHAPGRIWKDLSPIRPAVESVTPQIILNTNHRHGSTKASKLQDEEAHAPRREPLACPEVPILP